MDKAEKQAVITIRPAVPADADGIARTYIESAEYHAGMDPERYLVPAMKTIVARYREGRQQPAGSTSITLVAESDCAIVGFVDVRLD